jgi:hypothetical protein
MNERSFVKRDAMSAGERCCARRLQAGAHQSFMRFKVQSIGRFAAGRARPTLADWPL